MTLTRRVRELIRERGQGGVYECGNCGESFELNRQQCPCCGSYRIERSRYDDLVSR